MTVADILVFYIILGFIPILALLMIWSKTSQTVALLREANIYLKHIAAATETAAKLPPGGQVPPGTSPR